MLINQPSSLEDIIKSFKGKTAAGIYKITNPNNRIYVGCTDDFLERLDTYRRGGNKNQKKIHRSLKKHGVHNHLFEILEVIDEQDKQLLNTKLGDKEIYWGMLFDVLNKNNLTLKLGRRATLFSQETKDQIGETQRIRNINGKPVLQYTDKGVFIKEWPSVKAAVKGITGKRDGGGITSCCRGIVPRAYGFIWRFKFNSTVKGFKVTSKKSPVYQYNLNGIFIREWVSIIDVQRKLGINQTAISGTCRGIRKTAGGFIWRYSNDDFKNNVAPHKKPGKCIDQYELNGVFIKSWDSINEAAISVNTSPSNISGACTGKYKTAAKYIWKYKNIK